MCQILANAICMSLEIIYFPFKLYHYDLIYDPILLWNYPSITEISYSFILYYINIVIKFYLLALYLRLCIGVYK
jgi:hypothetical protein